MEGSPKFEWSTIKFVKKISFTPSALANESQSDINEVLTYRMDDELKSNTQFLQEVKKAAPFGWLCGGIKIVAQTTFNFSYASLVGAGFVKRNRTMIPNPEKSYFIGNNSSVPIGMVIHPNSALDSDYHVIPESDSTNFTRSFLAEHEGWTVKRIRESAPLMDGYRYIDEENPVTTWIRRKSRMLMEEKTAEKYPNLGTQALNEKIEANYNAYMKKCYPVWENRIKIDEKVFDEIVTSIDDDNQTNLTVEKALRGLVIRFQRLNPPKRINQQKPDFTFSALTGKGGAVEWATEGDSELMRAGGYIAKQSEKIFEIEQSIVLCISVRVATPPNFHKKPMELQMG